MNHREFRPCPYDPTCRQWTGLACGGDEADCPARDVFGGMVCVTVAVITVLGIAFGVAVLGLTVWR